MHRRLATHHTAGNLDGPVRDHFIGVHICLRAAPVCQTAEENARRVFLKLLRRWPAQSTGIFQGPACRDLH